MKLTIADEHMKAFEEVCGSEFEELMVDHLTKFAQIPHPSTWEHRLRPLVGRGIERAQSYGFITRGPVQFYLEVCILLGIDFDTDPQYPWARRTLFDRSFICDKVKADQLYDDLIDYLEKVGGANREFSNRALKIIRAMPLPASSSKDELFYTEMHDILRHVHPEKVAYLGVQAIYSLTARSIEVAEQHALGTPQGAALMMALMFIIGHGCVTDPLFEWIPNTLKNTENLGTNERVRLLHAKSLSFLDIVLKQIN